MNEGAQAGCAEKQGFRRTGKQGGERRNVGSSRESPWCGVVVRRRLCLRNPFRESAERGTQTSEWGKNSVSLPVLHPFSLARPLALRARCHSISLSLSLFYHFIFLFRAPSLSLSLAISICLSGFLSFSSPLLVTFSSSAALLVARIVRSLARFALSVTRQPSRT